MTDFVIVAATIAVISASSAVPGAPGLSPERQPVAGSHLYPSLESCQQEAAHRSVPPGRHLFCIPVETLTGESPNAY